MFGNEDSFCMTENHEVYVAGIGYKKVKDLRPNDVIINEVECRVDRIKIIKIY
jgi:hypothetical protein